MATKPKPKSKSKRHNRHYFLLPVGGQKIRIGVKCRDAKTSVLLHRKVEDVLRGTQGLAISCGNAQTALRECDQFPHAVHFTSFTDTRAYIVDRLDARGVPASCIKYAHNQGDFQKQFDTKSKRTLAKMSGVEKTFILSPPPEPTAPGEGTSPRRDHSGTPGWTRQKRNVLRGDLARAIRAGVIDKPEAKAKKSA